MPRPSKFARRGLTLVELVVVVAILAVLAMIILPKLDGLQNNANHAVAANSVNDTGRYIQTYRTAKQRFPDGWDSLTDGTNMWAAANVTTLSKGLHTNFYGTNAKFSAGTLTADDVTGLKAVGVGTVYDVTPGLLASKRPGDVFTTARELASGAPAVFVNETTTAGINIINRIYRQNQRVGTNPGTSGDIPDGHRLLAVGFGPLNSLIGTMALEAPAYANVDSSLIYNRNIVLFEVGGSKALFKGVVAADGDLLDDLTTYINRDIQ
jgi:prepilin-type N-terminal cleavage/methylation domain-containing protein